MDRGFRDRKEVAYASAIYHKQNHPKDMVEVQVLVTPGGPAFIEGREILRRLVFKASVSGAPNGGTPRINDRGSK